MTAVPGTYKNEPAPLDPRAFQPGTIGVIGQEQARYHSFTNSLIGAVVALPPGSTMRLQPGVDVCGGLNSIIRTMRGYWLWIMGDDHVFPPDILLRLLEHLEAGADVVVPHCLKRHPGWEPVVYAGQDEDGWYYPAELPEKGLTQVHAAGSAGMLVRKTVLDAIGDPWFTPSKVGLGEDVEFCRKVRDAGFDIWCDPEILLGHTSIHSVWPEFRDGRWHISLHQNQGQITIPVRRMHEEFEPLIPREELAPA